MHLYILRFSEGTGIENFYLFMIRAFLQMQVSTAESISMRHKWRSINHHRLFDWNKAQGMHRAI